MQVVSRVGVRAAAPLVIAVVVQLSCSWSGALLSNDAKYSTKRAVCLFVHHGEKMHRCWVRSGPAPGPVLTAK